MGGADKPPSARRLCMIELVPSTTAVSLLLPAPVAFSCVVQAGLQSGCLIWNATLLRLSGSDHVMLFPSQAEGEGIPCDDARNAFANLDLVVPRAHRAHDGRKKALFSMFSAI